MIFISRVPAIYGIPVGVMLGKLDAIDQCQVDVGCVSQSLSSIDTIVGNSAVVRWLDLGASDC
jgi:hypothetical protein